MVPYIQNRARYSFGTNHQETLVCWMMRLPPLYQSILPLPGLQRQFFTLVPFIEPSCATRSVRDLKQRLPSFHRMSAVLFRNY
jgi:hypothetical protein